MRRVERPTRRAALAGACALLLVLIVGPAAVLVACGGTSTTASPSATIEPGQVISPTATVSPLPAPTVPGTIAYIQTNKGGGNEIWGVRTDGTELTHLAGVEMNGSWSPAWSPDGRRIAYSQLSPKTGTAQLWVMKADGSGKHVVAHPDAEVWMPAWSPNGTRIAVSESSAIHVVAADGTSDRAVTKAVGGAADLWPVWATDATILFVRDEGKTAAIRSVAADGGKMATITDEAGRVGSFTLSPDGAQMAVHDRANDRLVIMPVSGEGTSTVLVDGLNELMQPDLWVADSNMWGATPNEMDVRASWSPDGTALAFAGGAVPYWASDLYVVNADGSGLSVVPDTGMAWWPAWQPE